MRLRTVSLVGVLSTLFVSGVASAQPNNRGDGFLELLFSPFLDLAQVMINILIDALTFTPTILDNPPVQQVHELTLNVAVVTSVLVVAAAGIYLITGSEIGISYQQARLILPRLLLALGLGIVSLPLLQLGVQASNAFVEAFRPPGPTELEQLAGLSTSLVLVWFINAWLLLALALLFVFRGSYLLFGAATSPLIGVAWAFPNTRRYAKSFISAWFALLAVAPIDVLVLNFNLAMLRASGSFGLQPVSNWILGTASFVLMLWVPYQLYGASQAVIGGSTGLAGAIGGSWRRRGGSGGSGSSGEESQMQSGRETRRRR